jgi:uncharacterized membrane protein (DUF4010 family)
MALLVRCRVMDIPVGTIVALLGGMAVGLERQWSGHATGPQARFGGIRTFALLGGLAGVAGWLWSSGLEPLAIVLLLASSALVVMAYVAASRIDVDATTEVSALVVLAAGVLAGVGQLTVASAIFAVTSLFLVEKSHLHALATRIDDESLRAAARFAVMAVVVLPLLPAGPFGPFDVRPRGLWMLVLFCSGLSFAGFLAARLAGANHGYAIAGTLGGLISSTNVTFTFARASRRATLLGSSLAIGVVSACAVLFIRVVVVTSVLNADLAKAVVGYLVMPFAVSLAIVTWGLWGTADKHEMLDRPNNPLQLWAVLQMAAIFQVVLLVVALVHRTWGEPAIIVSGAVLGLTDVDALTIAMARGASSAGIPIDTAARAIVVGLLANTALKLAVATVIGVAQFRRLTGPALAAIGLAIAGALALS